MRQVTVSCIQLPWELPETDPSARIEANVATTCRMLEEAGKRSSDIAVLGEAFPSIGLEDLILPAEDVPGPIIARLSAVARRHRMYLVAPLFGRLEGKLHNLAVIVGRDGSLLGSYAKVHPVRTEMERGVVPGESFVTFQLDFGRIGVMICHDNSFVESARCLALEGAEIIFWPHMQGGWGDVIWDVTLRSRAVDNSVWLASASYGVTGKAWRPGMIQGRSGLVSPDGTILAEVGRGVGIATASVDLDHLRLAHDFTCLGDHPFRADMLADRRPEAYRRIVKGEPHPR